MVGKIGWKFGYYLFKNKYIIHDEIEIIRFGFELIFSEFLTSLIITILSILTSTLIETVIYIVLFRQLRKYGGGYHSSTILRCSILTVCLYLGAIFTIKYPFGIELLIIYFVSAYILFCELPMVEHHQEEVLSQ